MHLNELINQIVIRTKPFGSNGDRSYMCRPILIEKVENEIAYYRDDEDGKINLLPADLNDEFWVRVSDVFIKEHWSKYFESKTSKTPKPPVIDSSTEIPF